MPDERAEKDLLVRNKMGLHARPAALIVQTANRFPCEVALVKDGQEVNGNARLTPRDRGRLDDARSAAAKAAGGSTAAAFLSLLGALLGAGRGAAQASRRRIGTGRRAGEARDRELGRTSSAGGELPAGAELADRDRPTILPPTH